VITVGLGSPESARIFSSTLDFPLDGLYADPTGACYSALGFSPGFAPGGDINPYLKLLPMLAGIGSPGTLQEVRCKNAAALQQKTRRGEMWQYVQGPGIGMQYTVVFPPPMCSTCSARMQASNRRCDMQAMCDMTR
jgi:hypothetical protein